MPILLFSVKTSLLYDLYFIFNTIDENNIGAPKIPNNYYNFSNIVMAILDFSLLLLLKLSLFIFFALFLLSFFASFLDCSY